MLTDSSFLRLAGQPGQWIKAAGPWIYAAVDDPAAPDLYPHLAAVAQRLRGPIYAEPVCAKMVCRVASDTTQQVAVGSRVGWKVTICDSENVRDFALVYTRRSSK